jgi:hypothetical protein
MKCLIVYRAGDRFFGSEVNWKRSGSGHYREISGVEVPQSPDDIEKFAETNGYSIEWRGAVAQTAAPASSVRSAVL